MRTALMALLLTGLMVLVTGCATPAYSGGPATIKFPNERASGENANNILRAWHNDSRQLSEDINSVLLLEPGSRLTIWNIR